MRKSVAAKLGARAIEAAPSSDVVVRYLCANTHPDRDSVGTLRTAGEVGFQAAASQQARKSPKNQPRNSRVPTTSTRRPVIDPEAQIEKGHPQAR